MSSFTHSSLGRLSLVLYLDHLSKDLELVVLLMMTLWVGLRLARLVLVARSVLPLELCHLHTLAIGGICLFCWLYAILLTLFQDCTRGGGRQRSD